MGIELGMLSASNAPSNVETKGIAAAGSEQLVGLAAARY